LCPNAPPREGERDMIDDEVHYEKP
jgi:hypothetical protein